MQTRFGLMPYLSQPNIVPSLLKAHITTAAGFPRKRNATDTAKMEYPCTKFVAPSWKYANERGYLDYLPK